MLNWISTARKKPNKTDADEYGCVLAVHKYNGVMVMGWREAESNSLVTYWTHTPVVPDDALARSER